MALTLVRRQSLPHDTIALSRWLLGRIIVRQAGGVEMSGRIVETEAYVEGDEASHSICGPTARNRSMYLARGHAYVYFIYGTSFMLNIASGPAGEGHAVLIRALEPLSGVAEMERRRGTNRLRDLTRGPGRLAQALNIDRTLDGVDLCRLGPLWLAQDGAKTGAIVAGPRIGITRNIAVPWRFMVKGSPFVSGTRRDLPWVANSP
jgi:DNA-3-methyladenine glycosylase